MTPEDRAATGRVELDRFVEAQDTAGAFDRAVAELREGTKRSHWMWFVFPQLAGLGRSPTAVRFAVSSLAEAVAYRRHPVLGPRLLACTRLVASAEASDAEEIFGAVDAMKLRSSMTLFLRAAPGEAVFAEVLDRYFGGVPDDRTVRLLEADRRR